MHCLHLHSVLYVVNNDIKVLFLGGSCPWLFLVVNTSGAKLNARKKNAFRKEGKESAAFAAHVFLRTTEQTESLMRIFDVHVSSGVYEQ